VLPVNLLELFDRLLWVFLGVEEIEALVVKPIGGFIRGGVIFLGEKIEAAAGTEACRQ
jgi:hypothetical protein